MMRRRNSETTLSRSGRCSAPIVATGSKQTSADVTEYLPTVTGTGTDRRFRHVASLSGGLRCPAVSIGLPGPAGGVARPRVRRLDLRGQAEQQLLRAGRADQLGRG